MTPACMGGWCAERDKCAAYHQNDRREVMERQCVRGQEMPVTLRPLGRPLGTGEPRAHAAHLPHMESF